MCGPARAGACRRGSSRSDRAPWPPRSARLSPDAAAFDRAPGRASVETGRTAAARRARPAAEGSTPPRPKRTAEGRQLGEMEDVVGVAAADAGHRALIAEHGVHAPFVVAGANE